MLTAPVATDSISTEQKKTNYPEPFASRVDGRTKRKLGDAFGLTKFGVNLTHLVPGSVSALLHSHSEQDEFIYVLDGTPTLIVGEQEYGLVPGDCMGFKAGSEVAHQLLNRSSHSVTYIEIGDRSPGDECAYPLDDLSTRSTPGGGWEFTHKDGSSY
jgi:uncharacterized cupin superfamily protein